MPKKAGPKRIDPETFMPVIWRKQGSEIGHDTEYLVCKRRVQRGASLVGVSGKKGVTAEYFIHPAAIQLNTDLTVVTGLLVTEKEWEDAFTEEYGISERCAKIALAEAYHGVRATLDLVTMELDVIPHGPAWIGHKNGVRMRNLLFAIQWDHWEKECIKMKVRLLMMEALGHPCTEQQIRRFGMDHGL